MAHPLDDEPPPPTPEPVDDRVREPVPTSKVVAWAVGVGVGLGLLSYVIFAVPVYVLAGVDRAGLDRPVFRNALLTFGLPAALVIGIVAGVVTARIVRRGHTWTAPGSAGRTD